jgi:predicted transcriptional regulator
VTVKLRQIEVEVSTAEVLEARAAEQGVTVSEVVAEIVAVMDFSADIEWPDAAEDLRRYYEFKRTGEAVPLNEVKAWVESWGSENELPAPKPRKIV